MPSEERVPVWSVGDRMAKAREVAGLSQEAMAELFDVSRAAIGKWERDEAQPRDFLAVITRWSEITKVPAGWLLWGGQPNGAENVSYLTLSAQVSPSSDRYLTPSDLALVPG